MFHHLVKHFVRKNKPNFNYFQRQVDDIIQQLIQKGSKNSEEEQEHKKQEQKEQEQS